MAGPTYNDYATTGTGTVVSPVTVSWHSGSAQASGTMMLAFVSGSGAGGTITPPSGWTTDFSFTNGGGGGNYAMCGAYHLVAGASEPTGYVWTSTTTGQVMEVTMVAYTNASSATPVTAHSTNTGTSLACPTATAPANNSLLVISWSSGNSVTALSTPSGCTLRATAGFGNGIGNIAVESNTLYSGTSSAFTSAITGTNFEMNSFIYLIAPLITQITVTDTVSALSDSFSYPTLTAPIPALTDTISTLSDAITNTVTAAITFNNDTLSALSDSVTSLGPGKNFTLVDTVYPVIDNFQLVVSGTSSSEFIGISEAIQAITDSFVVNNLLSITITDTGPAISDTLVRADTIPILLVDGISPGLTDSFVATYLANFVITDTISAIADVMLISASLIATISINETLAPKSDGFTLILGLTQFSNLAQEVFPFSAQTPSTQASSQPTVTRLQFFPFASTIPPIANTPSVSSPTQTTFPMTPETGI